MGWGAIASAGIGAASSYFGNKGNKPPPPPTAEDMYLGSAMPGVNQVMSGVQNLQQQQYYPDSTVAPQNPMYSGALNNLYNNPTGAGYQAGFATPGMDAMTALSNGINNPNASFNYGQGTFDQSMANLMPAMQGTYDAATRDNNRQLNWSTLPGIDMGQSFSGQQGSTKGGQQSALAQSMTGDRNADIGASIYQNAVNQSHQAGMSAGTQNLNAHQNMLGLGANALNNAAGLNQTGLQNQYMAGSAQQQYDQSVLSDDVARWNFDQQAPWNDASDRMNIYNMGRLQSPAQQMPNDGLNTFEALTQGANTGLQFYNAWQNPSSSSQLQPFDTSQYASMYKLQPFDTSQYASMYKE